MIRISAGYPQDPALSIVTAAFARSVTASQVLVNAGDAECFVFVNPSEKQIAEIQALLEVRSKVIVFGAWPGCPYIPKEWQEAVRCTPAPIHQFTVCAAAVRWTNTLLGSTPPLSDGFPLKRFDFADEWNNLGYGSINVGGLWGLAGAIAPPNTDVIGEVVSPGLDPLPYAAVHDTGTSALLWWNRPVGPVDHSDWALIEHFLADFGAGRLPCQPIIEEVPFSFDAAVTMRLDCDEDIGSAAHLFELYQERKLPFSLAVMTGQEPQPGSQELLRSVHASGGAILTHSATHAPDWGGSAEACAAELTTSCDWLQRHLPGLELRHAVSPFHQSPHFLPKVLDRHGLSGFIGGIIANHPETLVARGGVLPGGPDSIVTHSQQCMLHGDCMLAEGDPLRIPKQALAASVRGGALFGYLDHPISPRYDYAWGSFDAQLDTHIAMLDHIAEAYPNTCWMSADGALDWISAKSRISLHQDSTGAWRANEHTGFGDLRFTLRHEGQRVQLGATHA